MYIPLEVKGCLYTPTSRQQLRAHFLTRTSPTVCRVGIDVLGGGRQLLGTGGGFEAAGDRNVGSSLDASSKAGNRCQGGGCG